MLVPARQVSVPAITSECPFRYLVAACMTRSAPSASGRVSTGVATVESTASRAPTPCAISATAAMSLISHKRVGRRLQPDQPRPPGRTAARHGAEVGRVDQLDREAPAHAVIEQPAAQRPVHHARRQHVVARGQRLEHRRRRRHARGEQQRRGAALQLGEQVLGRLEGRDCRRARRPARRHSRRLGRAGRSWPAGFLAPAPGCARRSGPGPAPQGSRDGGQCLRSWHRSIVRAVIMRASQDMGTSMRPAACHGRRMRAW